MLPSELYFGNPKFSTDAIVRMIDKITLCILARAGSSGGFVKDEVGILYFSCKEISSRGLNPQCVVIVGFELFMGFIKSKYD